MNSWDEGYVSEIDYTYGYYIDLNPLRTQLAFLAADLVPPKIETACELGFGQGLSVNIHAAASQVQWYGTDFNPGQACFAQEMAASCDSGARIFDDSFADFCLRDELPDFDYIGLHGIWSWISNENRAHIVDFVRRKLKVGGVLYISYNTLPGWTDMVPLRDLMLEHTEVMGSHGKNIGMRIDDAMAFMDALLKTKPAYTSRITAAVDRLENMKKHDAHYLAHEFFNRDWDPMPFAAMARWLEPAKLQFACSENYLDALDNFNLTPEQQQIIGTIPDPMFRQSVRDFCVNQQFRKDYWIKGARKINRLEKLEHLRNIRVVLAKPHDSVSMEYKYGRGKAQLDEKVYRPLLEQLKDFRPKSLGWLEQALSGSMNLSQLMACAFVLANNGTIYPAQEDAQIKKSRTTAQKLNKYIMHMSRGSKDVAYLASAVTGGGLPVSRLHQIFLLALSEGCKTQEQWAQYTWKIFEMLGERVQKDGKALMEAEENLAYLNNLAADFAKSTLPVLQALQVL